MKTSKSLTRGVLLLTLAAAASKICGVLFKIPLYAILGDDGMGYFNSAYVLYTFFYVFTTSGLPVGLSILVANAPDARAERAWLVKALIVFGTLGCAACALMMIFPSALSDLIGNRRAFPCVFILGPALLFVCLEGALRGYFQGKKNMLPTAVSQSLEAVLKTGLGLFLASYAVKSGRPMEYAAASALLGITAGSFLSLLYLVLRAWLELRKDQSPIRRKSEARVARLLAVVLPVSAAAVITSLSSVIDLSVVMRRLLSLGYTEAQANALYGNYSGLALPLFNMPSVLIAPVASALIPHFTTAFAENNQQRASSLGRSSLSLAMLLSAPFFAGLSVLSEPILKLLFDDDAAMRAAPALSLLAPSICFVALCTVSSALLQAAGVKRVPVIALLLGAVVKIASCWVLIGRIGILGAPVGTFLCYFLAALIDLGIIFKKKLFTVKLTKTFLFPLLSALFCAGAAKATQVAANSLPLLPQLLISIFAGAAVYITSICVFGCADEEIYALIGAKADKIRFLSKRKVQHERKSQGTDQGSLHL